MTTAVVPPALLWLGRVMIVAAAVAAYSNSFSGQFVFDDHPSITDNPYLRHLWPLTSAMHAPPQVAVSGRPVVSLTLAVNYAIGGLNVTGYHVFNLLAHAIAALALFEVMRLTAARVRPAGDSRLRFFLAVVVALFWVSHPLQTETVTYVSNRTELLMGMFYLLTIWCSIKALDGKRLGRSAWSILAVACCALGMGCKEVMVSAPVMVALYDRIFVFAKWRIALRKRVWLYLGLAATWIPLGLLVMSQPRTHSVGFDLGMKSWDYLMTQAGVILHYLRLSIWPHPLIIIYDWPVVHDLREAIVPGAAVLALLALTVVALLRRHWTGFLGAWFFLILAPSSSFIPLVTEIVAERRMYLPLAAVLTLIVAPSLWALSRIRNGRSASLGMLIAAGAITFSLVHFTRQRNRDYFSEQAIWQDAVLKSPNSSWAHNNFGMVLMNLGEHAKAEAEIRRALDLMPTNAEAQTNLGIVMEHTGRMADAIDAYRQALKIDPAQADALINLARLLTNSGAIAEAEDMLKRAVMANPLHVKARLAFASHLQDQVNRPDEALEQLEAAYALAPDQPDLALRVGVASLMNNETHSAISELRRAVRADPSNPLAHAALGEALLQDDQFDLAAESLQESIRLGGRSAEAYRRLGTILARLDRLDESAESYQRVLELQPDSAEAMNNLGTVEARRGHLNAALDLFRRALLINPNYTTARANLAEALYNESLLRLSEGDRSAAIRLLEQAIEQAQAAQRDDAVNTYRQKLEAVQKG